MLLFVVAMRDLGKHTVTCGGGVGVVGPRHGKPRFAGRDLGSGTLQVDLRTELKALV